MTTAVRKIAHDPNEFSVLPWMRSFATWARSRTADGPRELFREEQSPESDEHGIYFGQMGPMSGYAGFGVIDNKQFEMYEQIRMLPSAEDIQAIVSEVDLRYLREFATATMTVAVTEARRECMGLEAVQQFNGWFAMMEKNVGTGVDHAQLDDHLTAVGVDHAQLDDHLTAVGVDHAKPDDHLAAALIRLDSVQAEAEEEGEQIPSDSVISKARAALRRIHPVAQRTYDISGMPDGGVVIEVETPFGASFVLIVEADAGAHCLMAIGSGKVEQRKYTDEEMRELPNAFMKDALARLPRI